MQLMEPIRATRTRLAVALLYCLALLALTLGQGSSVQRAQAGAVPQVLFGMGTEASGARTTALATQAPLKLLTSWYNGPSDLNWMSSWQQSEVPHDYAAGYALQLIVYSGNPHVTLSTPYGTACGQAYPLSAGFLSDMTRLAQIYNGSGPLYVSLFAEFQTYACTNNQWNGSQNYWRALKDQYRKAVAIFHQYAPNSRVSLCWGGWQTRWDDPANGGGRSLFQYFSDVMSASDFQSFQAMASDSNVSDVQNMTATLHQWGPVMLSYYKPGNNSQTLFNADVQAMLTDNYLAQATANGLFGFAFMDDALIQPTSSTFGFVKNAVQRYGTGPSVTGSGGTPSATAAPPSATATPTTVPPTATATATAQLGGASFATGFEGGQPQPSWTNTVDSGGYPAGGLLNVSGICCGLAGPETGIRSETAHTGGGALMYSGQDTGASSSYAYLKLFDLSGHPLAVGPSTTLSYWIYPQSGSSSPALVSASNSTCVAVDLIFADGSNLRDAGAVDQAGRRLHPAYQCGHLTLDAWNHVTSNIGAVAAGKAVVRIDVGYDQPANTGGYRGYLDDLSIQ